MSPPVHAHALLMQEVLGRQTFPQAPAVVLKSTHVPKLRVSPHAHVETQAPPTQEAPAGQTFSHLPQFYLSVVMLTSQLLRLRPPQSRLPFFVSHSKEHLPSLHLLVAGGLPGHLFLHSPQLFTSLHTFGHTFVLQFCLWAFIHLSCTCAIPYVHIAHPIKHLFASAQFDMPFAVKLPKILLRPNLAVPLLSLVACFVSCTIEFFIFSDLSCALCRRILHRFYHLMLYPCSALNSPTAVAAPVRLRHTVRPPIVPRRPLLIPVAVAVPCIAVSCCLSSCSALCLCM